MANHPSPRHVPLPAEILDNIFSYFRIDNEQMIDTRINTMQVGTWENIKALGNLCRACKQFQGPAQRILYQTFIKPCTTACHSSLHSSHEVDDPTVQIFAPLPHLHRVLRTLIARPKLREYVKNVHIGCFENSMSEERHATLRGMPNLALKGQLWDITAQYGLGRDEIGDENRWFHDLYSEVPDGEPPSEDAEIALLLCLADRAEVLSINLPDNVLEGHKLAPFTMSILKKRNTPMTELKKLRITSLGCVPTGQYEANFRLPQTGHDDALPLSNLDPVDLGGNDGLLSNQITNLMMHNCGLERIDLERHLQRCDSLQSFSFRVDESYMSTPHRQLHVPTWPSMLRGLSRSAESLRSLDLYLGPWTLPPGEKHDTEAVLSQFKALTKLKTDEDSWKGLRDREAEVPMLQPMNLASLLPPYLEELEVTGCSGYTIRHLHSAMTCLRTLFPSLRQVRTQVNIRRNTGATIQQVADDMRGLEVAMLEAGISYEHSIHDPLLSYLQMLRCENPDDLVMHDLDDEDEDDEDDEDLDDDDNGDGDDLLMQDVDDEADARASRPADPALDTMAILKEFFCQT